jgi:aspartate ammonia-lyase
LRIKAAAATANAQSKTLTSKQARLIQAAVKKLLEDTPLEEWPKHFVVDAYQAGAGTSQNMNVNEVVAHTANCIAGRPLGSSAPIHPNDHVNRSQSTNDSYPTAMRLALLDVSEDLQRELEALAKSFAKRAKAWKNVPKSARTHLQDAVPMSLGQEFGAYAKTLGRCAEWVAQGRDGLRELGLGGSAAGTGLNVPRKYPRAVTLELSRLTGEKLRLSDDLCEAMQSQAPVTQYSAMLRLSALELTRICNDLRILVSGPMTGVSELILPAVQPGSSIMPGKINPSIVEMANQAWFSVLGYDQTVAYCAQAGQLELNVMMPMMAYSLLEATTVMTRALAVLRTRCIDGIEPNLPRLRKYFESTPQIATALSPLLGYEATAKLVKEALEAGISVPDLVRSRKLIPEAELKRLLDPKRVIFGE